ncbi:hypothetical protein MQE36_05290 [Zhouia spongiae]|uniref:PIN domain-containing protein n=1 Tax=Zhouia spongiae TaxID=2202721 RepID=A0ABY3YQF4_9FLAO|nr:hypothetical protein [Zhouia spongiae]UNY99759.1 hypothetical protein MQE36_05290 [Zhouia spongiae]
MKHENIILIDADVVSHFINAGEILLLGKIFKTPIKILDKVYSELERWPKKKTEVDNLINFNLLDVIPFPEHDTSIRKEYLYIKSVLFKGEGESACMAVARYNKNVLASNNLSDIGNYCQLHNIIYLTTADFLYRAYQTGLFTEERCNNFIKKNIKSNKNYLGINKMNDYKPRDFSHIK